MGMGGSHRPTNLPYVINSESGLEVGLVPLFGASAAADYQSVGGVIILAQAAATLNIGDAVFQTTTANQWNKSTTVANYLGLNGIVVGGRNTDLKVVTDYIASGTAPVLQGVLVAATALQEVLIMISGIFYAVSDVALATINTIVTGGAVTAGRVTTTGVAAGNHVGITMGAAAGAGQIVKIAVGALSR